MTKVHLTVKQMIEQGGFSDFHVLAGRAGIENREVKTVCVVDVPDIEGWVFGGEFLLTSGYIFKDDPEMLLQLIDTADKYNAAALGVKLERYLDRIPQSVLRAADKLSFPLIGIPSHYAHTDIINPVLITMSDQTIETMNLSDNIHKEFFDLLLSDGCIDSILSLLHKHISRELLFVDVVTGERFAHTTSMEFSQLVDNVPLASLTGHFSHEKIILGEKIRGYLFMDKPINGAVPELVLKHAKEALLLSLKLEHERWKLIRGRDTQFVQDVLYKRFRQDSEVMSRGHTLGWNLAGKKAVVVIGVDTGRSMLRQPHEPYMRAFENIRLLMNGIQDNIPHAPLENEMAFIMHAPVETWPSIKEKITKVFSTAARNMRAQTGLQLAMGVGSPVENILSCNKSFREASKALILAQQSGSANEPVFWEEMGAYRFLAPVQNSQESLEFINEYLGKLMESNGEESDSLLNTLFCIISNNWQLRAVAERMNLHYNTVKYRYKKIGETTGMDIDAPSVRINLSFAMELYKLNKFRKEYAKWED